MSEPTFNAPIPGQSLTSEPRGMAWERPPEMNTVKEALAFYLNKLEDEDVLDDIFAALEEGFPLDILVSTMLTGGVMNGQHSVDIKVLIQPVLHELLLIKANANNINVVESSRSIKSVKDNKAKRRMIAKLERAIEKMPDKDEGKELLMETKEVLTSGDMSLEEATPEMPLQPIADSPMAEPAEPMQDEPVGLMTRRN